MSKKGYNMFDVGRSLRAILKDRNITQSSLAETVGCHQAWISQVANKRGARPDTIDRICKALNLKPSEFIAYGED